MRWRGWNQTCTEQAPTTVLCKVLNFWLRPGRLTLGATALAKHLFATQDAAWVSWTWPETAARCWRKQIFSLKKAGQSHVDQTKVLPN